MKKLEIFECEQQSPEWFELRLGIVTASQFAVAKGNGSTRKTYMMKLLAEILTGLPQDSYSNGAMEWGKETEAQARAYYEESEGVTVRQVGFIKDGDIGCSPDGLITKDGGLEIKCPQSNTHLDYILSNRLPSVYKPQVQGSMWVTGRKWWDFVSFDPRVTSRPYWRKRVERDDHYIMNELQPNIMQFVLELKELRERIECPF